MRKILLGWLAASAAFTACAVGEGHAPCETDAACGADAVCSEGYCIADPLPLILLAPDRSTARVGEVVRIDGSASTLGGAPVTLEFQVEPADAAELARSSENLQVAELRVLRPHVELVVTASAASAAGRTTSASVRIGPSNSPPRIRLRPAVERFGAGDRVELVAEAADPDGDGVSITWSLVSGPGHLEPSGGRALLSTAVDSTDRYQVRVDATDGQEGGETWATLTLEPEAFAPTIDLEAPAEVEHACEGEPLVCSARANVAPAVRASSAVSTSWRLLGDGPVTATFEDRGDLGTVVDLRCDPGCPLAGSHLLELAVRDARGLEATAVVEVRVGNRPPILRVHDGYELPHDYVGVGLDGAHLYRVGRPSDPVLAWHDPDGDPPALDSIEWSSSDGSVTFEDPASLSTGFEAIGTASALRAVELRLVASDWNGGTGAASSLLPIGNRRPSLHVDDVLDEGHHYAGGGSAPFRKPIRASNLHADDADGDPLAIELSLPADSLPGLELIRAGGEWLIGGPVSVVGFDHEVLVTARDEWGDEVSATAKVRLTNRAPIVSVAPGDQRITSTGLLSLPSQCCGPDGSCTFGTRYLSGPLEATLDLFVEDPDGDPVDLHLVTAEAVNAAATIASQGDWREIVTEVLCSVPSQGWCSATVRMIGRLTTSTGFVCDEPSSTMRGSFVFLHASGVDALGDRGPAAPILLEAP
ncbi:MAG TPA: hypothetical protein VN033_09895 [Vulgatibacter sp.]|nr:hypothetical protein [Vulgatibacter sp.]